VDEAERLLHAIDELEGVADSVTADEAVETLDEATLQVFWPPQCPQRARHRPARPSVRPRMTFFARLAIRFGSPERSVSRLFVVRARL